MWSDRFRPLRPRRRIFTHTLAQPLQNLATLDGCWASARVVDDGLPVGLMRRTLLSIADADTGWQFFSGDESEEYLQDWSNLFVHSVNLVANCDPTIVASRKASNLEFSLTPCVRYPPPEVVIQRYNMRVELLAHARPPLPCHPSNVVAQMGTRAWPRLSNISQRKCHLETTHIPQQQPPLPHHRAPG